MKITHYEHGKAFEVTLTLVLRGEIEGLPNAWADMAHEERWISGALKEPLGEALGAFYGCKLRGTTLTVKL